LFPNRLRVRLLDNDQERGQRNCMAKSLPALPRFPCPEHFLSSSGQCIRIHVVEFPWYSFIADFSLRVASAFPV